MELGTKDPDPVSLGTSLGTEDPDPVSLGTSLGTTDDCPGEGTEDELGTCDSASSSSRAVIGTIPTGVGGATSLLLLLLLFELLLLFDIYTAKPEIAPTTTMANTAIPIGSRKLDGVWQR
jgi:hypothetical protein